jgi:ribonuclease Z
MAGAFAKRVGAAKLVLNHIGGRCVHNSILIHSLDKSKFDLHRFPAPRNSRDVRAAVMSEIERQASEAWGMGTAKAAWDFMRVVIPAPDWTLGMDHQVVGTTRYADPEEGFIYPDRKRKWERGA